MKKLAIFFVVGLLMVMLSSRSVSQSTGDFRTHQSGSWYDTNTWEQFDGAVWVSPAPALPDTLHMTTILSGDSVALIDTGKTYVGASVIQAGGTLAVGIVGDTTVTLCIANGTMNVYGTMVQKGKVSTVSGWYAITTTSTGDLVIGNGGIFHQEQNGKNGGTTPHAVWDDGSTLLVTGLDSATSAGGRPGSYYNIIWNCPGQVVNANMGMHPPTGTVDTTSYIRGDLTVLSTGLSRVYFCGPNAGVDTQRNVTRVFVNGDITVLNKSILSSNGTSKAYTDIIVTVLGNIEVRDSASQVSISRGSQSAAGTATWYIQGDVYYGPKTTNQNSTDPNTGATSNGKFVFNKAGTQTVTLDSAVAWSGACNMQFGDSVTVTTVNIGNSPFIGSGATQRIKHNATVIAGPDGYIGGGTNANLIPSSFTIEDGAALITASENGIRATGMGSSGAVRVSGDRNYATAANFEYNGTTLQRLGSGFPASANNLTINNAAGVFVDSVSAFTIDGTLAVISGDLDLNGYTITLGPAGLLSETSGNTVTGTSGVITTTRTLTSPSSAVNIAGLGVQIGSAADLGSTILTRDHAVQGVMSVKRYFDIRPTTNTGLNATLIYRYDASELNGLDAATMLLWKSEDGGLTWGNQPAANNAGQHTLTVTGLNSLSRWCASDLAHPLDAATLPVMVNLNWNMISLPCMVVDARKTTLFPLATSDAFAYDNQYIVEDTLKSGIGYWLKFAASDTVMIPGVSLESDTIDVIEGWNMIGSISEPIAVTAITSEPPGLVTSQFFSYEGAYVAADSIRPGKGYWVKATEAGQIIMKLSGSANPKNVINIVAGTELPPPPPTGEIESRTVNGQPLEFSLSQNYPNPFNPSTKFDISLPANKHVLVAVYNLLGQKVSTLLNEERQAGIYSLVWNGLTDELELVGSGIYLIRMITDEFSATAKIVLMK